MCCAQLSIGDVVANNVNSFPSFSLSTNHEIAQWQDVSVDAIDRWHTTGSGMVLPNIVTHIDDELESVETSHSHCVVDSEAQHLDTNRKFKQTQM